MATLGGYENRGFVKKTTSKWNRRGLDFGVNRIEISAWEDKTKHLYASFGNPTAVQKIKMVKPSAPV